MGKRQKRMLQFFEISQISRSFRRKDAYSLINTWRDKFRKQSNSPFFSPFEMINSPFENNKNSGPTLNSPPPIPIFSFRNERIRNNDSISRIELQCYPDKSERLHDRGMEKRQESRARFETKSTRV